VPELAADSVQLELRLEDQRLRIPWEGLDLRSLTKCGKLFIREKLPTGGLIGNAPLQLTLFLKGSPHGS